jgi:hypothetical protein
MTPAVRMSNRAFQARLNRVTRYALPITGVLILLILRNPVYPLPPRAGEGRMGAGVY